MKKTLIIIGLLICTFIFLLLGFYSLDAASSKYSGISAVASLLASAVSFIFGYKGWTMIVERLARWIK